jgi:hypothetical protein
MLSRSQIKALAAGFICMLIYGSAYTYGTLIPYVTSYLYYSGNHQVTKAIRKLPPIKWHPYCSSPSSSSTSECPSAIFPSCSLAIGSLPSFRSSESVALF